MGLERYEPAFRESEIDAEVLPELTESDLVTLGLPLGPRRKLLKAIAALREAAPPAPADEPPAEVPAAPAASVPQAERRQLTVLFCDLVCSTALSARLDPEDLRAVIAAYHRCVAAVIERAGGFVAKYMGDGVLAYFGYPRADEHDAGRAVRAGLQLVEAVSGLDTVARVLLQVRVGIATGLVVAGDLIGEGEARERGVVGETPNLAARLQALAEPGTVVIASGTRRLIGGLLCFVSDISIGRGRRQTRRWQRRGGCPIRIRWLTRWPGPGLRGGALARKPDRCCITPTKYWHSRSSMSLHSIGPGAISCAAGV